MKRGRRMRRIRPPMVQMPKRPLRRWKDRSVFEWAVWRADIHRYTGLFPTESMAKEWASISYGQQFTNVTRIERIELMHPNT